MEQEFTFGEDTRNKKESGGILKFLWNSETKELLGRDGASWAKVSLFYAVFYTCLGSFFVGMLAVFMYQMPKDKPTYYGESSTMNARRVNPGLGFRPQIDVEDHSIIYNPNIIDNPKFGYKQYVRNLENFLNAKYGPVDPETGNAVTCVNGVNVEDGKVCEYNYKDVFAKTPCTSENSFGYPAGEGCVLLKLNKIVSWKPQGNNVTIKCDGETSADKDNLVEVKYYYEGESESGAPNGGVLDAKYFPFWGSKNYRAPFVFAQFIVAKDTLVNIECRAYDLDNIDNKDRLNRRGMTKFSIFVGTN